MLVRMKLDLGCGATRIQGYTPWDWATDNDVSFLPFEDNSIDEIRASHLLEHIERVYLLDTVKHWVAKLKPGGILRIAVPDFDAIIQRAQADRDDPDQTKPPYDWEGRIIGGGSSIFDQHHTLWNDPKLRKLFAEVGIDEVVPWKNEVPIDSSDIGESLNLAGRKKLPSGVATKPPDYSDIRGVMTMPRLTWTDNAFCINTTSKALNFEVMNSSGVFYGQGMQRMLTMVCQTDLKWVLTIDYDSLFDWKDLVCLREIAERDGLDAIAPLQSGRERTSPLGVACDENWNTRKITAHDLRQDWYKVSSMHFGCTLIRIDALRKVKKPWFFATPNADGEWEGQKVDDDIHFWKQCQEANLKIGITPKVSIGHLEVVATWPGHNLASLHQPFYQYLRSGKPWYVKSREGWRDGSQDGSPEIVKPA